MLYFQRVSPRYFSNFIFQCYISIFPSYNCLFPSYISVFPAYKCIFRSYISIFLCYICIFPSYNCIFPSYISVFPTYKCIFPSYNSNFQAYIPNSRILNSIPKTQFSMRFAIMGANVCWMKSWRVSRGVVSPDRGTKTVDYSVRTSQPRHALFPACCV